MPVIKKRKRATIIDVARRARVSTKTVSHVINDKPGVGQQTRARVMRIIEEMGYHPNIGARSLGGRATNCVGVTLSASPESVPLSEDLFVRLSTGLFRAFGRRGDYICFDINPYSSAARIDYARGLWEQLYRACVVMGPLAVGDPTIRRIHEWGEPYVVFGRLDGFPECSCATVDYEQGAYESTKHLIGRGHTRIGLLAAFSGYQPGVERVRGYQRALADAGMAYDERLVRPVTFPAWDTAELVHEVLQDATVSALVDCSSTEDGPALREGAARASRKLGEDVDVVTWSYSADAAVLPEACAQLWLPTIDAAMAGVEELARWCHGGREEPIQIVLSPVLCETVPEVETSRARFFDAGITPPVEIR
jgi:LacI family transcriptional regulator, galactose operon repressor